MRLGSLHVSPELVALAAECGVATEYWDQGGQHQVVPEATIIAVLSAMGIDAATPEQAARALEETRLRPWRRVLPPVYVTRVDRTEPDARVIWCHVAAGVSAGEGVRLQVLLENAHPSDVPEPCIVVSAAHAVRVVDGADIVEHLFRLPEGLPLGWHTVQAVDALGEELASCPLAVVPTQIPGLPDRSWGVMAQLYSVRSRQSWAQGDYRDLATLAELSASTWGADFVLVNPLHAGSPIPPLAPSPYLPVSRRFLSPFFLSIPDLPEYANADAALRAQIGALAGPLEEQNTSADLLDRDAVWAAKVQALTLLFERGLTPARREALASFCLREGSGLRDFATWCAFVEDRHAAGWRSEKATNPLAPDYPIDLPPHGSPEALREAERLAHRIDFHMWLQFCVDEQLARAQDAARAAGMTVGVMHDLAVGVHPDGADAWAQRDVMARQVSVGCPPDAFNMMGQDWSQPPWDPVRLAEAGFLPFRDMVRTLLRHAGALRIDHILGLFRLWWIPLGGPASQGTYVRYDHEALLGILALEAQRAGAIIVGEDLGTVEYWVADALAERGILGASVLWFEYAGDEPAWPQQWRRDALASVTVHDLPPTLGYLRGEHVRIRASLGLLTVPEDQVWASHREQMQQWRARLVAAGVLDRVDADDEDVLLALHRYAGMSPSRMLGVALVDMVGDVRTQNQPGTDQEYPNWRIPLCDSSGTPVLLEDLPTLPRAAAVAQAMTQR